MAKRVLIIDDEPDILKMIETRLKMYGLEVMTAYDGVDGLHKAQSERPDLVITDLILPKLDGWRICQRLKNDPSTRHIPVIMLSGTISDDDSKPGEAELGDAYLTKPFVGGKLMEKVVELLSRQPGQTSQP